MKKICWIAALMSGLCLSPSLYAEDHEADYHQIDRGAEGGEGGRGGLLFGDGGRGGDGGAQ